MHDCTVHCVLLGRSGPDGQNTLHAWGLKLRAGRRGVRYLPLANHLSVLQNIQAGSGIHPASSLWVSDVCSGIKRRERESDQSFLYTADMKNEWSYSRLFLYIHMPCTGTPLPLPLRDHCSMHGVRRKAAGERMRVTYRVQTGG